MMRDWLKRRREEREQRILDALERNPELTSFDLSRTTNLGGGIYPYLARLERAERIVSYWRIGGNRRRRYYALNPEPPEAP